MLVEGEKQVLGVIKYLKSLAKTSEISVDTCATWSIHFCGKYCFKLVLREEKDKLLREFRTIP